MRKKKKSIFCPYCGKKNSKGRSKCWDCGEIITVPFEGMWWEEGNTKVVGGILGMILFIGILLVLVKLGGMSSSAGYGYFVILILGVVYGAKIRYGKPKVEQTLMMLILCVIAPYQFYVFGFVGIGILGRIRGDI